MDSTNSAKEDLRSISEQEAARQQQQAQATVEQDSLIQQAGLPPVGIRVTASIPGITIMEPLSGVITKVEQDEDGGYTTWVMTDQGAHEPLSAPWEIKPAAQGDGTRVSPLRADDARDVVAAAQQNTHPNLTGQENTFLENDERQSPQPKGGGMFWFLISILIVAGLGYRAYSSWQESLESERTQQAQEARKQIQKNSVIEMASKANAVTDWAKNLADDGGTRRSPVLTAELQKQWVINRPILLLGYIEDIVINPDATYQVNVVHNWVGSRPAFLQNDIRMSLRCPESVAAPLIRAAKTGSWKVRFADTAITAVIENIVTTEKIDATGDTTTVLTGLGQCLNAIYLTERISWP